MFTALYYSTFALLMVFAIALLGSGNRSVASNRYLAAILLANALIVLRFALAASTPVPFLTAVPVRAIATGLFAAIPALVFLWERVASGSSGSSGAPTASGSYGPLVHFVPAATLAFCLMVFPRTPGVVVLFFIQISFLLYYGAAWRHLSRRESARPITSLSRIRSILLLFGVHWLFSAGSSIAGLSRAIPAIAASLEFVSILLLLIFAGSAAVSGIRALPLYDAGPVSADLLSAEETAVVSAKLSSHMESHHEFLDPTLTIADLATRLGVPQRHVSYVLNAHLGVSFTDYINRLRVDYARELLVSPARQNDTILAILHDAGFNSKSAFNRVFKEVTGQTPSAFRRAHTSQLAIRDDTRHSAH